MPTLVTFAERNATLVRRALPDRRCRVRRRWRAVPQPRPESPSTTGASPISSRTAPSRSVSVSRRRRAVESCGRATKRWVNHHDGTDFPLWGICPYDTRITPDFVLDDACPTRRVARWHAPPQRRVRHHPPLSRRRRRRSWARRRCARDSCSSTPRPTRPRCRGRRRDGPAHRRILAAAWCSRSPRSSRTQAATATRRWSCGGPARNDGGDGVRCGAIPASRSLRIRTLSAGAAGACGSRTTSAAMSASPTRTGSPRGGRRRRHAQPARRPRLTAPGCSSAAAVLVDITIMTIAELISEPHPTTTVPSPHLASGMMVDGRRRPGAARVRSRASGAAERQPISPSRGSPPSRSAGSSPRTRW